MAYPLSFPQGQPLVTVTHPSPTSWIIEMHHGEDNRMTETFISKAMGPALDAVERDWRQGWRNAKATKDKEGGKGSLIVVGKRAQHKFFSNGLDYDNSIKDPNWGINFFRLVLNPFYARLLTFPIPIVTAINGHCFAAAMIMVLCCDYRVMVDGSARNAWMCMSEIHFGAGWPFSIAAVTRAKVGDARIHRKIALEGHRFTPPEALAAGLVDHIVRGDTDAVIAKAREVGDSVSGLARSGAWGVIKRDLYRDVLESLSREVLQLSVTSEDAVAKARL